MGETSVARRSDFEFEAIGYWSEIKLDIIRQYATAYSTILAAQTRPRLCHIYVDGFAGGGVHVSRASGELIPGSPTIALEIVPRFREYHLIDLDRKKVAALARQTAERDDVWVYQQDCNEVLLETVLPRGRYEDYKRVLCVLDPYGLHLDWQVIAQAGSMRSVEIFLNFPVADINRNVLWRHREGVSDRQEARLTRFWGDDSWKSVAYHPSAQAPLWGDPTDEKATNEEVAAAFRQRLKQVAGFKHVPPPLAMRNSKGTVVYYLYFASQKPVAEGILSSIFDKYRNRGGG